jgi:branched-chain amino acid transport system permease protein
MDVIQFAHGDVLMLGAFTALVTYLGLDAIGITNPWLQILIMLVVSMLLIAVVGALVAKYLILPLKDAPPLNTLLLTLMLGLVLRELVRLFYPDGSNSKPFPRLLPDHELHLGAFSIRAVAQDGETARVMGINFHWIVLLTFGLGSAMAAIGGIMNGLYYSEINFGVGLLLGIIGFSAAILGGLTNVYGAILGGFLFAALQTIGSVMLPLIGSGVPSSYKDVFAFAVVIMLLAWKPSGLIAERSSERV